MGKVSKQAIEGQLGVNLIEKRTLEMGYRWATNKSIDVGIDGHIEICDQKSGEATNQIVLVQSKAGESYFRSENETEFTFFPKAKDLSYWSRGSTPVIVILSRPRLSEAYWIRVPKEWEANNLNGGLKIDKLKQRFDGSAAKELAEIAELENRNLVEIQLNRDIWEMSEDSLKILLKFISSLEPNNVVRIVAIGSGSIRLILDMSCPHASILIDAHIQERLIEFQIRDVRIISFASLNETLAAKITVDTSISYVDDDQETTIQIAKRLAEMNQSVSLIRMQSDGGRDSLIENLFSYHKALIVMGRGGIALWSENKRMSAYLGELVANGVKLLPLFAYGAPPDSRIPNFWKALTAYDFRQGYASQEFHRLSKAIIGSHSPIELDLVLCIDTTGSMEPILDHIKTEVRILSNRLQIMLGSDNSVGTLRVRIVEYRDVYDDPSDAFKFSIFYSLPQENDSLQSTINQLKPEKGGDSPENGLEGIVFAMRSDWSLANPNSKRMIIVFSDAGVHPLGGDETHTSDFIYLKSMPVDLSEMEREWDRMCQIDINETKLVLVAPQTEPWPTMSRWQNVVHIELDVNSLRNIGVLSEAIIREIV